MLSVTALATILVIDVADLTIAAICVIPEPSIPISETLLLFCGHFIQIKACLESKKRLESISLNPLIISTCQVERSCKKTSDVLFSVVKNALQSYAS